MAKLVLRDPLRDVVSLRDAMDRLFEESFISPAGLPSFWGDRQALPLDVFENDDNLVVETALAGVKPEDVDISVVGNTLTIKGETRREEKTEKEGKYHCCERRYGAFQRTIALPVEVDPDKAEATFENGVLKLTLPKIEAEKPRKISVKAS